MGLLKLPASSFVLLNGLYYWWTIMVLPAGYSIPLAGPLTNTSTDNSTLMLEGSGHGSLVDAPGVGDDDETDDGNNWLDGFEDDGGGGGGVDAFLPETTTMDTTAVIDRMEVKCFRCHGDGINGCDVIAMLQDIQMFSITCYGKCLNLSSGSTAVYDCAHDMVTKTDTCLKNRETEMCFCTGDFCNGPSETDEFYHRYKTSVLGRQSLALDKLNADDLSYHYYNKNNTVHIGNNSPTLHNELSIGSKVYGSGRHNHRNFSGRFPNKVKTDAWADDISKSWDHKLTHETSTYFQNKQAPVFPFVHKTKIDVIISEAVSSLSENVTSKEIVSSNYINIHELPLGNYKDRGKLKFSSESSAAETVAGSVLLSMCSVLLSVCSVLFEQRVLGPVSATLILQR